MDDQPSEPIALPPPHERGDPPDHDTLPKAKPALPPPPERVLLPPPAEKRSRWGGLIALLLVLLIVAALVAWVMLRSGQQHAASGRFQSSGPMPVGTASVAKGDMPIVLTALGTVTPLATVTVKTQINGQLIDVAFKEGQMVNKGDLLAQIDPRPYQVALAQAEGQLAKDRAALANAETDLARYRTLVSQNSIARQTLDTQVATVAQDRATIQADQAQVDAQKLNLTYCRIVAPVGGRVGLRQVDPGNYVQTSDATGLVVITQLQPISVIFTLPEDNLQTVMQRIHAGATLSVTAYDRTGATLLDTGSLATVDNQIDTTTGTVKLRSDFNNPGQTLFPNQFVNVRLLVDTLHDASLVPSAAIQRGAPGTFVYLVKSGNTVTAQPVTLGPNDSENVAITKGLQPGQVVVTDGADRLKDGAKVRVSENDGAGSTPPAAGSGGANQTPTAAPNTASPGSANSSNSDSSSSKSDTADPDAGKSDASKSDAANPDTTKPDAADTDKGDTPAGAHKHSGKRRRSTE
ncbi:MAG TPA: MdtA/MuxA family multidrug efflux RND transporter periplasmic adaptor subunit [Stellaceae bacterium]|jgi:multidrug efflux system membrane fusion protein|nr:MdtA/MuxA family multidrug efflux RND transporter periplasmic adaptor subunit [Stellaceae bacterium]